MERDLYENKLDRELYHSENAIHSLLSQKLDDKFPLKESNFSITQKILSSIEKVSPLKFTPYISILPQKNNLPNSNPTDESLTLFERDTVVYLDHKATSCDKDIISSEEKIICEEEKKNGVFAIILETKNNIDISKFKEEVLFNCGDVHFANEGSIIYERDTDLVLGREEKEKEDDKISELNHNIDRRFVMYVNTFLEIIY